MDIATRDVRGVLEVPDERRVVGARLLVVDDVLAEGSTLREVALALRRAGAAEVAGLVLARPGWDGPGGSTRPSGASGRRGRSAPVGERRC